MKMVSPRFPLFAIFVGVLGAVMTVTGTLLDLDQLKASEKTAIWELRDFLAGEMTDDYMMEDAYLAKWLAVSDFSVELAAKKLREHLKWRDEEKIAKILDENWEEMNSVFPYTREHADKAGRPLLYFDLQDWDVYKHVTENSSLDALGRYLIKMLEESNAHVRQLRAKGSNITQFNLIINLGGYDSEMHGCLQCLYFYRNIANILADHYPRSTEKKILVNVPPLFEMVYSFLSEPTQKLIKVYGQDRRVWGPILLEYIDRNQVPGHLLQNGL